MMPECLSLVSGRFSTKQVSSMKDSDIQKHFANSRHMNTEQLKNKLYTKLNTLNCTVSVLTYMTRGNVSLLDLRRWPEIFIWLEVAEGWSRHKTRDAKYLKQANRKMTSPSVLLSALVLLMKPLMAYCFLWTRLDNVTSQGKVMRVGIFGDPFHIVIAEWGQIYFAFFHLIIQTCCLGVFLTKIWWILCR